MCDIDRQVVDSVAAGAGLPLSVHRGARGIEAHETTLGPQTYLAGGAGILWVGDSSEPVIYGYIPGQEDPAHEVRAPFDARPVSKKEREQVRSIFESRRQGDAQWARYVQSMGIPDRVPYFQALEVDRSGNLWVKRYEVLGATGPEVWAVFSKYGEHLAFVTIPETAVPSCSRRKLFECGFGQGIMDIGDDYILVHQNDRFDVSIVSVFGLLKGH
jgi:hypothetical protein